MKLQVSVIILILAIVVKHVQAAVTISDRTDVSNKTVSASKAVLNKEFKLEYYAQANWFNAWLACLSCGMKLASITSQEEQDTVEDLINEHDMAGANIWIAGNDLATEGRFNWFTSGGIFQYTNWGPNEPNNNGNESCVEINGFRGKKWNDRICTHLNFYLCEKTYQCS